MLELLLNYTTAIIAAILLLGLIGVLFFRRKQLTKSKKVVLYLLCAIIAIYFVFIGIFTFAFGNKHPLGEPSPQSETYREDYNRTTEKHNYNWKLGLQTQDDMKNLGTLLILDNDEEYLKLELGFSGEKAESFETQIRVYYDYKPIDFRFNENDEFSYYYDFSMENHSEYTLELLLNPQNLIDDDNIHKLFVTATTGNKTNAKDLGFSNAAYGTSVMYDVAHKASFTELTSVQSDLFSANDNFIKVSNDIFSPRTVTLNQDKQFNYKNEMSGISTTLPVYEVSKNGIEFNSFISCLKDNEDFLVLICFNFEPYMWAYIPELKSAGTYFSEFNIDLPEENANYEFTAYTIASPFEKISNVENQFVQSSNRFTIVKSQSTE